MRDLERDLRKYLNVMFISCSLFQINNITAHLQIQTEKYEGGKKKAHVREHVDKS